MTKANERLKTLSNDSSFGTGGAYDDPQDDDYFPGEGSDAEASENAAQAKRRMKSKRIRIRPPQNCTHNGCEFTTIKKVQMNRHRKDVHGDIIPRKKPISKQEHIQGKKSNRPRVREKKFSCDVCGVKAASMWYINRHMRLHTGEKPFVCEYPGCSYQSYRKYHLTRHNQNVHSTLRPHVCEYCNYSTKVKESLRQHVLAKHTSPNNLEACQFCDYKTKLKSSLRSHERKNHKFSCKNCVWEFEREVELADHLEKHKDDGIICDRCSSVLNDIEELKSHSWSEHNFIIETKLKHKPRMDFELSCQSCKYQFISLQSLNEHQQCHTVDGLVKCQYCGHLFHETRVLLSHVAVQHGITIDAKLRKPGSSRQKYSCLMCLYEFKSGAELQSHIGQHRLDGTLKCSHCSNLSQNMEDFLNHCLMVHNKSFDATPYDSKNMICCKTCGYLFPSLAKLNAHKRKHMPDGTILCIECPVNLSDMEEMKLHLTLMHGIKIEATKKLDAKKHKAIDLNKIFFQSCKEKLPELQTNDSHWCSLCFYRTPSLESFSAHMSEVHAMGSTQSQCKQYETDQNMQQIPAISGGPMLHGNYNPYIRLPLNVSSTSRDKGMPLTHELTTNNHHMPHDTSNIDELLRLDFLAKDGTSQQEHSFGLVLAEPPDQTSGFSRFSVPSDLNSTSRESTETDCTRKVSKAFPGLFV